MFMQRLILKNVFFCIPGFHIKCTGLLSYHGLHHWIGFLSGYKLEYFLPIPLLYIAKKKNGSCAKWALRGFG